MNKNSQIESVIKKMKEEITIIRLQRKLIDEHDFLKFLKSIEQKCEEINELCES